MTAEQIQQIREKYKNPLYMKNAINNVAGILAEEYIKQEMKVETEVDGGKKKMEKTAIKMTRFDELENVLLNQIEMLNDESILTDKESATIAIEKSKAISDLTGNFTVAEYHNAKQVTEVGFECEILTEDNERIRWRTDLYGLQIEA